MTIKRNISNMFAAAFVMLAFTSIEASAQVQSTTSGIVNAAPADGVCYRGDCAKVTTIRVHLPLDATIIKIRLLSAGVGRSDLHENSPGSDIQWATWGQPVQGTTPTNKFVDAKFLNRSHDQHRKVQVVVEWRR